MCSMCMKYEALIMNLIKSQCAYKFLMFCLVVAISPVSLTHIIFDNSMDKKNRMHSEVWHGITYPSPNFNGCTIEVWNG